MVSVDVYVYSSALVVAARCDCSTRVLGLNRLLKVGGIMLKCSGNTVEGKRV